MARTKKQKYESCVKQVKGQEGYNPYAVCRSSVYGSNKKALKKGMMIEKEHSPNPYIQKKIATDHLKENPDYYRYVNGGKEYLVSKNRE